MTSRPSARPSSRSSPGRRSAPSARSSAARRRRNAARKLLDDWTTKDDVDATKPESDLVQAALEKAGTAEAVMVGDTGWDIEAARRAGLETVCVITGGWSKQELLDAGAAAVYESIEELRQSLGETPLSFT